MVITEFQKRVYGALKHIPLGYVTSYRALAEFLSCPSPQAIGQALKKNPNPISTPCHRVISANGSIHGYLGQKTGPVWSKKQQLLQKEGVEFTDQGRLTQTIRMLKELPPSKIQLKTTQILLQVLQKHSIKAQLIDPYQSSEQRELAPVVFEGQMESMNYSIRSIGQDWLIELESKYLFYATHLENRSTP